MHSHSSARLIPVYIAVSLLMSMALAGCGTKPSTLSPPKGTPEAPYPQTYPDTATDPQ